MATYNSNGDGGGLAVERESETTRGVVFFGDLDFLREPADTTLETPVSDLRLLAFVVALMVMRGGGMGVDTKAAAADEEQEVDTLPATLPPAVLELLLLCLLSLLFRSIF
jgi:hypothetical protein